MCTRGRSWAVSDVYKIQAVDDVVRRVRAAEIVQDVADDYGVPTYVVELIAIAAEYEEDDCA